MMNIVLESGRKSVQSSNNQFYLLLEGVFSVAVSEQTSVKKLCALVECAHIERLRSGK